MERAARAGDDFGSQAAFMAARNAPQRDGKLKRVQPQLNRGL